MLRLGLLVVALMLGAIVLVSGAIVYGHINPRPNPLQTLGFDICEGKPCWHGIVPGITDWTTARNTMRPLGGEEKENIVAHLRLSGASSDGDSEVTASKLREEDSVTLITLDATTHSTLGDIMALYGAPCRVDWVYDRGAILEVFIPHMILIIRPQNDAVDLNSRLLELQIQDVTRSSSILCADNVGSGAKVIPWKGLASMNYYYSQGVISTVP